MRLGQIDTTPKHLPLSQLGHGTNECVVRADDGFVIDLDDRGVVVTVTSKRFPDMAPIYVPWAMCIARGYVEPNAKQAEALAPKGPPAALGMPAEYTGMLPTGQPEKGLSAKKLQELPAALRPPENGSTRPVTIITAQQAAGMSESALEAAVADGAIVERAAARPGKRRGRPARDANG